MKNSFICALALTVLFSATSCKKDNATPASGNSQNMGTHTVDSRLVGKWMWTKGSDGAFYDNNGVYNGSAYGLALEYTIHADGSGICFDHIYSSIGAGTELEVNISYQGFFESDDQGHLGFFPLSGTYKSGSGTNRALRADEVYNTQSGTGVKFLLQQLVITTQGGRKCFKVTSSDGVTDTFFAVP